MNGAGRGRASVAAPPAHAGHVRLLRVRGAAYFGPVCGCGWCGMVTFSRRDARDQVEAHRAGRL